MSNGVESPQFWQGHFPKDNSGSIMPTSWRNKHKWRAYSHAIHCQVLMGVVHKVTLVPTQVPSYAMLRRPWDHLANCHMFKNLKHHSHDTLLATKALIWDATWLIRPSNSWPPLHNAKGIKWMMSPFAITRLLTMRVEHEEATWPIWILQET